MMLRPTTLAARSLANPLSLRNASRSFLSSSSSSTTAGKQLSAIVRLPTPRFITPHVSTPIALGLTTLLRGRTYATSTSGKQDSDNVGQTSQTINPKSAPGGGNTNSGSASDVKKDTSTEAKLIETHGVKKGKQVAAEGKKAGSEPKGGEASAAQKANEDMRGHHIDLQNTTSSAAHEIKAVTKDFAEMIAGRSHRAAAAGGRENAHAHSSISSDFTSTTAQLFTSVPQHVLYFGLAGTIPYLATAVGTVALAREASLAATEDGSMTGIDLQTALSYLHTIEEVQITYGATILSFLGALHWGMEFAGYGGTQGYRRLALGTAPLLFAWPTVFLPHGLALAGQWAAFTTTWLLDQRASTAGWTPVWYSTYRFILSIIVGFSIIATLAGTSYYGAGAGGSISALEQGKDAKAGALKPIKTTSMKRLEAVGTKKNHPNVSGTQTGPIGGDVDSEDLVDSESGDGYVRIHHVDKDAEQAEQEEKDKAEIKEKQDTKELHQSANSPPGMKETVSGNSDSLEDNTDNAKMMAGGEQGKSKTKSK